MSKETYEPIKNDTFPETLIFIKTPLPEYLYKIDEIDGGDEKSLMERIKQIAI